MNRVFLNWKIVRLFFMLIFSQSFVMILKGQVDKINNRVSDEDSIVSNAISSDSIRSLFLKVKEYRVKSMSIYGSILDMERSSKNVPVHHIKLNQSLMEITLIKERFDKIMEQVVITDQDQKNDSIDVMKYYLLTKTTIDRISTSSPPPPPPPKPTEPEEKKINWVPLAGMGSAALILLAGIIILLLKWQKKKNNLNLKKELKRKVDLERNKQLYQARKGQTSLKI
jgi:hypothetical protein